MNNDYIQRQRHLLKSLAIGDTPYLTEFERKQILALRKYTFKSSGWNGELANTGKHKKRNKK